jgi:hypothetical protein
VAKLKAQKRRRIRLRRIAVIMLVIVALLATAVGIVTLRIRPIVLSALRKQLPNCEVSVGRAVLNPLKRLSLYDVRIVDLSNPEGHSTIEIDHLIADYTLRAGLKLDIEVDAPGSRIVLRNVTGESPPFPDLFARKPERKPSRFRLRRARVRDCHVTVDDPAFGLDAVLDVQASGLGARPAQPPADVSLQVRDLVFVGRPASAVEIGRLEGTFGYDATQAEVLERVLLHQVRARDCRIDVRYPDFILKGRGTLALANESGELCGHPTKLAAAFDQFLLEAGGLRTMAGTTAAIRADLYALPGGPAATMKGTLDLSGLTASLDGGLDRTGLSVEAVFKDQPAERLVDLFEREREYKIPFIHDFHELEGTIDRFELVLSQTPERGLGLVGAISASGLDGESSSLGLEVEGIAVDTGFSLLPPEGGGPLQLVVGDPSAPPGPGRVVGKRVKWSSFPVTDTTGTLSMHDNHWYLTDILGVLFEGRGTGHIEALADGTLKLDLVFDEVNLDPLFERIGREDDEVTGHADGRLEVTVAGGTVTALKGELRTRAPGGIIRFKEKQKSFDALPGGEQIYNTLKQKMPPRAFDHFLEKFKNYQYESITIDARNEGNDYVVDIKIRDADTKNPLAVDLTIRHLFEDVYHDGPLSGEEGARE